MFFSGTTGRTLITVIAVPVLRFHAMPITLQIEGGSGGGYWTPAIGKVLNDPLARGQLHHGAPYVSPYVHPDMAKGAAEPGVSALGVGCL